MKGNDCGIIGLSFIASLSILHRNTFASVFTSYRSELFYAKLSETFLNKHVKPLFLFAYLFSFLPLYKSIQTPYTLRNYPKNFGERYAVLNYFNCYLFIKSTYSTMNHGTCIFLCNFSSASSIYMCQFY